MSLPKFDAEEQYLINYAKSSVSQGVDTFMWGYLISGALVAACGAYYQSIQVMLTAFVVVYGFRIYESRDGHKWTALWRSVISKYEEAIAEQNARVAERDK